MRTPPSTLRPEQRYEADANGCWLWTGPVDKKTGYGRHGSRTAHSLVFEVFRGKPAPGMELDHTCRNRRCVNPDHLEPVTRAENVRRAARAKLSCPAGHPYDGTNTYVDPSGARQCRTCRRSRRT